MQSEIVNGVKKPTHIRVVDAKGKHRHLAMVVALNSTTLFNLGFSIEDPEYEAWKVESEVKPKAVKAPIAETPIVAPIVTEVTEERTPIAVFDLTQPITEEKEVTEVKPKSKGGRPSKTVKK